ncbi:serine/threonine-protein kinase Sgk2 [Metarhizium rileyi]|uniref:non-specific serine/threonine protein kinase n=1 Tax=Metarhizium rileyi (strain RCEF 4871) TaxID=1649241 RepID=A0A162JAM6_METRR|nr:serine/threonine-protein kinase Sgk2 [Metarhizium rileyi RCEF 4871]
MTQQDRSDVIEANPIGNGLDAFRSSFHSICDSRRLLRSPRALDQLGPNDLQNLSIDLLLGFQNIRASCLLYSSRNGKILLSDLIRVISTVNSGEFQFDYIKPLLEVALADNLDDALIWNHVDNFITKTTPPPQEITSSIQQTPWSQNTSSFVNSSELRQDVDRVLKQELGPLYVGIPNFYDTFFKGVLDLEIVAETVFSKCTKGDNPLFSGGWTGWPTGAKESDVLTWFIDLIPRLDAFAGDRNSTLLRRRKLLAQPKIPRLGSTGKRSMDIGFVNSDITCRPNAAGLRYYWSHVLIAGELKNNPKADIASIAWINLARYAREVLAAQDTRRFVLGFTLCGSLMRVWEFDRLGGIASDQFDINKNGQLFVTTILGFLSMDEENLGFDPTMIVSTSERYIEIERNGQTERLIIDEVMKRAPCIAGRATTCWKAHRKDDPHTPLVIKDSWQYIDRDEEGELIQEATEKGVINVARYYYHETVRVRHADDEIRNNIRKGLNVTRATNYRAERASVSGSSGVKRPSSETDLALPPSKRSCLASPTKEDILPPNRVHRRIILRDYGKPIYKASSRVALLAALEGCIIGHESLYNAGFLHRDISIGNLMMNEDEDNPSQAAFLIDLDLAIKKQREGVSGRTGTRAFMAIWALFGDQHSFMHDLESFFWVLFWICIHYSGPNERARVVERFDRWNYADVEELAEVKSGLVSNERHFLNRIDQSFTPYYKPMAQWVNKLRQVLFPGDKLWQDGEDHELYARVRRILQDARRDPNVTQE